MNRVKIQALTTSMMTPAERSVGRFLRAPDHPTEGGNDSPPAEDNKGGNPADSTNDGEGGDNTGQANPLEGFWDGKPAPADTAESDAESNQQSQALGGELKGLIDGFAPKPVFTKEISEQIAEGNFDGANEAIANAHKDAIRSSIEVTAKLLGAVVSKIQEDVDRRINGALGNKDNSEFLAQSFPQAKDPALAPMVKRVWDQALVNTRGDRQKAIQQTRGMLSAMGKEFAPDDIRQPAEDPTAGINTAASKSLVQSLLERS